MARTAGGSGSEVHSRNKRDKCNTFIISLGYMYTNIILYIQLSCGFAIQRESARFCGRIFNYALHCRNWNDLAVSWRSNPTECSSLVTSTVTPRSRQEGDIVEWNGLKCIGKAGGTDNIWSHKADGVKLWNLGSGHQPIQAFLQHNAILINSRNDSLDVYATVYKWQMGFIQCKNYISLP